MSTLLQPTDQHVGDVDAGDATEGAPAGHGVDFQDVAITRPVGEQIHAGQSRFLGDALSESVPPLIWLSSAAVSSPSGGAMSRGSTMCWGRMFSIRFSE